MIDLHILQAQYAALRDVLDHEPKRFSMRHAQLLHQIQDELLALGLQPEDPIGQAPEESMMRSLEGLIMEAVDRLEEEP